MPLYFDNGNQDDRYDINKLLEKTYIPEEKQSLLTSVAHVFQFPQSVFSYLLAGENPLKAFNKVKYPSEPLGLKGLPALVVDIGLDPLWALGGGGLKLSNLSSLSKKIISSGLDIDKLVQARKSGKVFKSIEELTLEAPKLLKEPLTVLDSRKKIEVLENLFKGTEYATKKPIELIKDLQKSFGRINKKSLRNMKIFKDPESFRTIKDISKWGETYKKRLLKKIDKVSFPEKEIAAQVGTLLGGEKVSDINKIVEIFSETNKLPAQLKYPEAVKYGLKGLGVKPPFSSGEFKTIAPNLQSKLAENIQKAVGGDFLQKLGVSEEAVNKWKYNISKYINPEEKFKRKMNKSLKLVQAGRADETDIALMSDFLGKLHSSLDANLAEFVVSGGQADETLLRNVRALFPSNKDMLQMTKGTEYIGLAKMGGEIARKFGITEEKAVGDVIIQLLEKPKYARDTKSLFRLPVWDRGGLDKAILDKITKEISDPKYQSILKLHKGIFDNLWNREVGEIYNSINSKAAQELLTKGKVGDYVFHYLSKNAIEAMNNPVKATKMIKGVLNLMNDSLKHRKWFRLSDSSMDLVLEKINTFEGGKSVAKIIGKDLNEKEYEAFEKIVAKAWKKVEKNILEMNDTTKISSLSDEISKGLLGDKADPKLVTKLLENQSIEMMSIPEANAFADRAGITEAIGGNLFETDIASIVKKRMDKHFEVYGKYYYTDELAQELVSYGLAKPYIKGDKVPERFIKGSYGKFKNYVLKKDIAPLIKELFKYQFSTAQSLALAKGSGALGVLFRAHQKFISGWKQITTSPFPSFHARNTFGNFFLMHQQGIPIRDIARMLLPNKVTGGILKGLDGSIHRLASDLFKKGEISISSLRRIVTKGGRVYEPEELLRLIKASGIERSGFFASEVFNKVGLKGFVGNLKDKNLIRAFGNISNSVESSAKISTFLWSLKKGHTPVEALNFAHKTLFNYGKIPLLVKKMRDNVFPFVSWYYFNIPRQIEMLAKKPQLLVTLSKLREQTRKDALKKYSKYEGDFPRERFTIYMPRNKTNLWDWITGKSGIMGESIQYAMEGYAPVIDLNKLANPFGEAFNLLAPTISAPLQREFNIIPALGNQPVERYEGETVTKLGLLWKRKNWNMSKQFIRALDVVNKLNPAGIFGTDEKPSIFGNIQTSKYTGNVPALTRGITFTTGLTGYTTNIKSSLWNKKLKLRDAIGKLKSELKKMSVSSGADKVRNTKLIQLNQLNMALKDIEARLEELE